MGTSEQEKSPLEKWFEANRNSENMGASLRLLLGHVFVGVFRAQFPESGVFSPEKALSMVQRFPAEALPAGFFAWISAPEKFGEDIVRFCDHAKNFRFPEGLELSKSFDGWVDLRGVRCPMGSVRARLVLAGIDAGEAVSFKVDDGEPIENIPRAMVEDGNSIEFRRKMGNYWELGVRKREHTK